MPTKELPFGFELEKRNLKEHMPRKETIHVPTPEVTIVSKKCAYKVEFERDSYGRIKSPITIKPI